MHYRFLIMLLTFKENDKQWQQMWQIYILIYYLQLASGTSCSRGNYRELYDIFLNIPVHIPRFTALEISDHWQISSISVSLAMECPPFAGQVSYSDNALMNSLGDAISAPSIHPSMFRSALSASGMGEMRM